MLDSIKALGLQIFEAEISLFDFGPMISSGAGSVWGVWETVKSFFGSYGLLWVLGAILIALSLLETFVGKKLLPVQKLLLGFLLGFILGTSVVYPLIAPFTSGFAWLTANVIGIAVGVIGACLCLPVYLFVYTFTIGYFTYSIMMDGLIPSFAGNKIAAAVAMAVVLILVFIFRKVVEIALTSALGGLFTYLSINYLSACICGWSLDAILGDNALIVKIAVISVVSVIGFIVQYRTRRRW